MSIFNEFRFRLRTLAALALLLAAPSALAGSVGRLFYDDVSGTAVSALTNSPAFPNLPTFREQLDDFTIIGNNPLAAGLQGKDNSGTQFGSYVRGYLEAPATGQYVFYIGSDDTSELWLSTDHLEDGKRRIAFESGSGAPLFAGPRLTERQSLPVGLVRGKRYYFEVLHKQGTGDSYLQVGWRRPDGVQEIIPALHLAQYPYDPYLNRGSLTQAPFFNGTGLNAGNLPADSTLDEGSDLLLQLDVVASQPTTIVWKRGSETIADEDLGFLRLRRVPASFDGSAVRAIVSNAFGSITSAPTVLHVTRDSVPPSVASVDTGGNPNIVRIRFSEPVASATATHGSTYEVRTAGGTLLPVLSATLLPDDQTVQLTGVFGFQAGSDYRLTVRDVRDLASTPNTLSPNPSTVLFQFSPASGTTWDFNTGRPADVRFFGSAKVVPTGGPDGSGFLELTDAFRNRNGAILFSERRDLDQVRIRFKVRVADGSDTPADGFSVNVANDLPLATLPTPEEGYVPTTPGDRLSFTFDTFANGPADASSIGVIVNNRTATNVLAAINGLPSIYDPEGRWLDVDIDVRRGGRVSIRFDGVTVLDQFPTEFEGARSAQVGFAARTGASWETHWFDNINLSFSEGDLGSVSIATGGDLVDRTVNENDAVRIAVLPTGASPYRYQWLRDGQLLEGETNRVLRFTAGLGAGGSYAVAVSNDFSGAVSAPAKLTVVPDLTAPKLVSVRGVAGGIRAVRLTFDEPLDPATATKLGTFSSPILQVLGATLSADGRNLVLSTSGQRVGVSYTLNIVGLKDRASAGNVLSTQISFVSSINYEEEILSDKPSRFWRFDEPSGTTAVSLGSSRDTAVNGTYVGGPQLGVPSLVPVQTNAFAVRFDPAASQRITVPNGNDINAGGPWTKKSFEFWFKPAGVPAPGTTGLAAVQGIFEEGAAARGIMFYLWRSPTNANPNEAELVFHAFNSAADGPGAPFGQTGLPAVFVTYTVRVGDTHHVVGVFDGSPTDTSGELRLYVDGVLVGQAPGIGQIYAHTGDVQIARGNVLVHTAASGDLGFFDGVLDDFALYSSVLPKERILAHYDAATGKSTAPTNPPTVLVSVDTRGNPNLVRLTFNQPVAALGATNPANYLVTSPAGANLPIQSVTLLADLATVDLTGAFNFQVGTTYSVTIRNLADQLDPTNVLEPNPTTAAIPFLEGGPVAIAAGSNLGDRTVVENLNTRFSVVAAGAKPYTYQWSFNGTPIVGATNTVLDRIANAATAGGYTVTIRNEFSEVTSPVGRLILQSDSAAPYVTALRAIAGTVNEVRLSFSEPLDAASATNAATYSIPGLAVLGTTLASNGLDVALRTSPQTNGSIYKVSIVGLKDQAVVPNVLNVTASVLSGISYRDEVIADGAVRYYPFSETTGTRLATLATGLDTPAAAAATASANPGLGAPGLIPNLPGDPALRFTASRSNRVTVPNGSDLNINAGPWSKRTFAFSFQAASLPRGGATPQAPLIYEEGAASRGFNFYLYGTQDVDSPTQADLIFHALNNVAADGAGAPWGSSTDFALSALFIKTPVRAGVTYHVVGVFDGTTEDTTGELRLFIDGKLVGTAGGVGQIYNHSGDIAFGQSSSYLLHDGRYITTGGAYFDGVLDEFAVVSKALDSARIAQLYDISRLVPTVLPVTLALVDAKAVAGTINEVRLTFNAAVDPVTGSNTANFRVGNLALLGAKVSADGRTVVLRTAPQTAGGSLEISVSGLKDADGVAPGLAAVATAVSTTSYVEEVLADGPVRYWSFSETAGTNAATRVAVKDAVASASAALFNGPVLGVPGLVPTLTHDPAIGFVASLSNRVLVPNGADLNITSGPWARRTFSLWFKATTLPRVQGTNAEAPVLWEEGGDNRGAALYLYGTQDTAEPTEALLVWNAYNNVVADGAAGGWGVALGKPELSIHLTHPVKAGEVYHVVAVLDGDATGRTGEIRLFVNGQPVGSKGGVGQIYNHSANIQLGRGAFVRHDGITGGELHYFNGVLDELAVFNTALSAERAAQLYRIGTGTDAGGDGPSFKTATIADGKFVVTWDGTARLQRATAVTGPFVDVPGASGRHEELVAGATVVVFRLQQ